MFLLRFVARRMSLQINARGVTVGHLVEQWIVRLRRSFLPDDFVDRVGAFVAILWLETEQMIMSWKCLLETYGWNSAVEVLMVSSMNHISSNSGSCNSSNEG